MLTKKFYKMKRHSFDIGAILTDDITKKAVFQSRAISFKPIRGRPQMRSTKEFYPTKASNFGMSAD